MLDFKNIDSKISIVDQEDRAMQRCNLSAWSMPEDEQEHILELVLLSSLSSFGYKAINLLNWCKAPTQALKSYHRAPVRHMSVLYIHLTHIWYNNHKLLF
jgi:hypothetical protein